MRPCETGPLLYGQVRILALLTLLTARTTLEISGYIFPYYIGIVLIIVKLQSPNFVRISSWHGLRVTSSTLKTIMNIK